MSTVPSFEFHVSRAARNRYGFADELFSVSGNAVFANVAACREFANRINEGRDAAAHPERAVHAGTVLAMGLIDEALHIVLDRYRQQRDPGAITDALSWYEEQLRPAAVEGTLLAFSDEFPTVGVYRGDLSARKWLETATGGVPHRAVAFEEMLLLWLENRNPAFRPLRELFDDEPLQPTAYPEMTQRLRDFFATRPRFGPGELNLIDLLTLPSRVAPDSLAAQLAFIGEQWPDLLGDFGRRLLTGLDILKEEEIAHWTRFHPPGARFGGGAMTGDSSAAAVPHYGGVEHEPERFSADLDWMPRTVLIAKSVYVWLDQLSKAYGRPIHRLDQVPDAEIETLARQGMNALWLIGVWERSRASKRIKQMMGNPEAEASAYSLLDYAIAGDLGGEGAYVNLRDRCGARGIRLASDMVPNHMGIDSRWVMQHPDWFLALPNSPYPAYSFNGPDLSSDGRVEVKIEDHYYDRSDAAVTFRRVDRWTGDTRFIYHGNDGTSFPWNDTAQLNYLNPAVREGVIQTILHVARLFPIIRFDAAMTLTKRHYQRLWFPAPGTGGAIPSRAEHGMSKAEFDRAMPEEFWREVVERVAAEVPGTLLLAEAFWLMEGYFVRSLGMHRVYNSAFMNMMRDEENANYRSVIKNTLQFDPEVLKRYVNFMNNPDERTAVDQFGKGDKYFGVCMLMATLPGLPMFGHGQIEGYNERYGMEYRRAYHNETPDPWLVARHERQISPLLHRRALFAEVHEFLLYDFFTDQGHVNEDVYAYSNRRGSERAIVVYNNRYADTRGWIRISCAYAEKQPDGSKRLRQRTIGEAFGLPHEDDMLAGCRDALTGLEYLHPARDLAEKGMRLELGAYQSRVLLDWREIRDDGRRPWGELCRQLGGRGVSSLDEELRALELRPVHDSVRELVLHAVPVFVPTAKKKRKAADGDGKGAAAETRRCAIALLEQTHQYATCDGAREAGVEVVEAGERDLTREVARFEQRLGAAMRLPKLEEFFSEPWPAEARAVLPHAGDTHPATTWAPVVAYCAMEAAGRYCNPAQPERATGQMFDAMRLREPLAAAFEKLGITGEDRWRAAARVRVAFAHAAWAPGMETPGAHLAWMHDPEVAWLIGVHEYEGVHYFVKEPFESLQWWLALPALLTAAEQTPDVARIREIEAEITQRLRLAAETGYRVDALLETARG